MGGCGNVVGEYIGGEGHGEFDSAISFHFFIVTVKEETQEQEYIRKEKAC